MKLNLRQANVNYPDYVVYLDLESWSRDRIDEVGDNLINRAQELVGSFQVFDNEKRSASIRFSFLSEDLADIFYNDVRKVLDEDEDLMSGQVSSWVMADPQHLRERFRCYSPHTGRWGENVEEDYTPDMDEGVVDET